MELSSGAVQNIILGAIFAFFIAIAWLLAEFKGMKDEMRERFGINNETIKLKLQAYERLTLFAERASLKNLVGRTPYVDLNVVGLQLLLIDTLKSEYEYNVSQQIYCSPEMWKAVSNLRDQNIYIINQLAATLPQQSAGIELAKRILEYSANNSDLSTVVLSALQFEAKRIL